MRPLAVRSGLLTIGVLLAAVWLAAAAAAAPKAELWPRWQAHDPAATEVIDHAPWGGFLARYLEPGGDGINRLAYDRVTPADRAALDGYVAALAATPISAHARPEQMAYWINLYNALTVQVVLDHYPVASIRDIDISPGWFASGPWGAKLVTIEGERVSLDDIEHQILRPIWRDPRIHYAVNCASLGCPNLAPEPYRAAALEAQLEAAAQAFVNHPRGAALEDGGLVVSSIYHWFAEDFGGDDAGVIAHLRRHAAPPLAAALADVTDIADHRYDWRLNAGRQQAASSDRAQR